jgi:hypothetical protein
MSLKAFHLVFIVASIALSIWFGVWCLGEYAYTESVGVFLMGLASFMATAGLSLYFAWVLKKLRNYSYIALGAAILGLSEQAQACAVCLGDPNSLFVKSANSAVLFLLAVITVVLVGFAGLFIWWGRRDRRYNHIR